MTTPTSPADELTARIKADPDQAIMTLLSLGDKAWGFLEACSPEIRGLLVNHLCDVGKLHPLTKTLLMETPRTFGMVVRDDPATAKNFNMIAELATMAVTPESVVMMGLFYGYYVTTQNTQGGVVPKEAAPTSAMPPETQRRKFLAAKRAEIARKLNVPIEDVIILEEDDIP